MYPQIILQTHYFYALFLSIHGLDFVTPLSFSGAKGIIGTIKSHRLDMIMLRMIVLQSYDYTRFTIYQTAIYIGLRWMCRVNVDIFNYTIEV